MILIVSTSVVGQQKESISVDYRCCWLKNDSPDIKTGGNYNGVVSGIDINNKSLVIDSNGKSSLFIFDSEKGTDEQKQLLKTLKVGDKIKLQYMEMNKAFHIEPIQQR